MDQNTAPNGNSYIPLFEKDDCKALWKRIDKDMLEFLLIKGERWKICVIDISNDYTVQQLTSLLNLIRREAEKRIPIIILPENVDIVDSEEVLIEESYEEVYAEEFEPIALPWHDSLDHSQVSKGRRMTVKRQYREIFGEDPDYTCPKCFKHFKQKNNMLRHTNTVHSENKTKFKCEVCGKHYKHRQHFEDHVKSHEGYMHQCKSCLEGFPSRNTLRAHQKSCGTGVEPKSARRKEPTRVAGPPFPESTGQLKIPYNFKIVM